MKYNEDDIQQLIDKRKKELERFDALPETEKRKATERGENPHEPKAVREKRKAAHLEKRKREFDALPKERRAILENLGVSPHQRGKIVNRSAEYFEKHGSYIVDADK